MPHVSRWFLGSGTRKDPENLAFLPAALEIVETPASPTRRAAAYAIMALVSIALAWACLGHVDIIASAKGKIIPSGRTKIIQPFETGVVRAIRVQDGQTVRAGEPMIELDPTMNEADGKHLASDLMAAKLDVARLQATLAEDDALTAFKPPEDASADMVAVQRKLLIDQIGEQRAKLAVLDRQRQQKEAERETIGATLDKLSASLPVMEERLNIRKTLYEHTTGSKASYLELRQSFVEEQQELNVQKHRYQESSAALATIAEQQVQAIEEYRRTRLSELAEAERKARGLYEDLLKAQHRTALQILTAPVDGTVQQLAVHTVGGVVKPAQTLLVLVPLDSQLEIQAMVLNRDIGFVYAGQEAEVKVDAFNFNRYGLIHGKVISLSPDAITREKLSGKHESTRQTPEEDTSEPNDQELVYAARISLERSQMQVEDKLVDLAPGMAVTVEIKTGSRRIISYLLSPLLRYKQETLRER
jgi:hemolysin D